MNPEANPSRPAAAPTTEPQTSDAAVPVWLIVVLFVLLFWGGVYFDQRSGWFDARVYAPYRSVTQVEELQPPKGAIDDILRKGRLAFAVCAACHMETGVGNPANGCPPLVDSEWVKAPGPNRLIRIISKGVTGPIHVKGQVYSTGTMLPIGDQLPGDEKQKAEAIAAIATYVRFTFGNQKEPVALEQVERIRGEIKGRSTQWEEKDLLAVPEDK